MKQQIKSRQSIERILNAGLACFSQNGYKGTSIKDIALAADMSVGRVTHHFQRKMEIFTTLLDRYWQTLTDPDSELNRLIAAARFPDDFEMLAKAIKEIVEHKSDYIKLIYIDVIEFKGEHINRFYRNMAVNFRKAYSTRIDQLTRHRRINSDVDPLFAVMMTFRFLFQYFMVETTFGVRDHFGFSSDQVIAKAKQLVLHGLLRSEQGPGGPQ